jgi:hypothetical protein
MLEERERKRERELAIERFLCMIVFIHLVFGCWILISSYAIYTLMFNFVMCFLRMKRMKSGGVIIRTTR